MLRWLALVMALFAVPGVFGTLAQRPAPTAGETARFRVSNAGPAVFADDGNLFVVGVGQRLEFYDLSEPETPHALTRVTLQGRPLALGAGRDVVLAAVSRAIGADEIVVVAPDPFRRGLPGVVNSLQSFESIHHLQVAPDASWAVALNNAGYQVLRLTSASVIESSALIRTADPPVDGALFGDQLLLAMADTPQIDRLPLQLAPGLPEPTGSLALTAPVTALTVSPDETLAAAALSDDTLVLFDPETMRQTAVMPLEDGPATALHFASTDAATMLVIQIANRPAVMLLDITDPEDVSLPGSVGIGPDAVVGATDAAGARFALVDTEITVLFMLD